MVFDKPAQLYSVFNPHAIGMVDFDYDTVVCTNLYIHEEILLILKPFLYYAFYNVFIYHTVIIKK